MIFNPQSAAKIIKRKSIDLLSLSLNVGIGSRKKGSECAGMGEKQTSKQNGSRIPGIKTLQNKKYKRSDEAHSKREKVFVNFLSKLSDELENRQKSHKTESVALGSAEFS